MLLTRNQAPSVSMNPFVVLILTILDIYWWVVIAMVIMSWLLAFNVVNIHNPFVRQVNFVLHRLTEPLLRPIRQFMPDLGGLDPGPTRLRRAIRCTRSDRSPSS